MLFPHYILDIFTSLSYSNSTKQTNIIMKLWRDCTCNLSEWSSRILWNCWWSAISPETSHNKEKQAMPWVPIRLGLSMSLAVMAAFLFLNHPFGLIEEKVELSGLCVKDWHSTIDEPLDPEVVKTMCSLMRTQFPCSCFPCWRTTF